ncbi:hypothetical protein ASG31_12930 [Chryseobacterium sp. Leaf404]|uniref:hypothetical protein n=1 Tax=unclassified Chryseobacterium TaxID=2593645 RepID=UPI0006F50EDE|nr:MULTISPECIES: hypothetical protein [unclassified Chryseobacterium]KQT16415.1 hypothetical protein ASG31_12930 [Chryseobacterium sp. Leaf404]
MKTQKASKYDEQKNREIDEAVSRFSQHLMSNSKWSRLINDFVENADYFKKIQFKKVQNNIIGELFINEKSTFEFDYWQNGFEGNNSLGGWLEYREIEYLIFPKIVSSENDIQDLNQIKSIIKKNGQFDIEINHVELKLICYKI